MPIDLSKKAQIILLVIEKMQILSKYSDFLNIFFQEKASILPKATNLNQYAIELQKGQQLVYKLIYSQGQGELEALKSVIETNLTNNFIWLSKLLAVLLSLLCKS